MMTAVITPMNRILGTLKLLFGGAGMLLLALHAAPAAAVYYAHTPATYNFIDPVAGGHNVAVFTDGAACTGGFSQPQDDDITNLIPIGFTFNYGGTNYTQLRIQTNGRLQFTSAFCGYGTETVGTSTTPPTYPFNFPTGLPSSIAVPNMANMIRIYGGDFDLAPATQGSGTVYYATVGTAPNRQFIVTWRNLKEWNNGTTLFNAQIILYENGDFTFQYGDTLNFSNGHAQIGWEISATDYDVLSYSTLGSLAYTAIRYYKAPTLTAQWHMDDLAWGGGSDVVDSSGHVYTGQAVGGASTIAASNAIQGNPGTCRYGQFDGTQYIQLPGTFPNLTAGFTITAWIRTLDRTKAGQRIFIDDENNSGGYGFSLGDGGAGILRFYSRGSSPIILDTSAVIQNNTWYFVAAVADIAGGVKSIYVYDASGVLLTSASATFTGWGTDNGTASIGGETNASGEAANGFRFKGNLDEVQVFTGALSQNILDALAVQTHLCPIEGATLGGFNAFDSSTAAGSTTGYISTKVAGKPFNQSTGNIDIVALAGGLLDTAYNGTVTVQLVDASAGGTLDPLTGCGPWPTVATLGTATFGVASGGRVSMSPVPQVNGIAYQNLKVMVSDGAGRVGCSSDAFALRPNQLVLSPASHGTTATAGTTSNLANVTVTGGQVHKAWQYFTLRAAGVDSQGTVLVGDATGIGGYSGSPSSYISGLLLPASGGVTGTFETGAFSGAGNIRSDTARYSEVGSFALYLEDRGFASVDAADTQAGDRYIPSGLISVGRFVPDHFYVIPNPALSPPAQFKTFAFDSTCGARSFTYIGQTFTYSIPPQALITARNAKEDTTVNYQGTLWKVTNATTNIIPTFTSAGTPALVRTITDLPTIAHDSTGTPTTSPGTGIVTLASTERFVYTRSTTTPIVPYNAGITMLLTVKDVSESGITGGITEVYTGAGASPNPTFTAIPFDAGNQFRYGRLRMLNANGSELLPLTLKAEAQYFTNAAGFITNSADSCTVLSLANVGLGNYQSNLSAGETTASLVGGMSGGFQAISLSAPGTGNTGSVDLVVDLENAATPTINTCQTWSPSAPTPAGAGLTYLQDLQYCTPLTYTRDPTARATFGPVNINPNFIYQRENY